MSLSSAGDARPCVDVIIVNWNAGPQLRECADSVLRHGYGRVGEIVVVDNGSVDGSDLDVDGLPGVTLLRAGENLGFGRACNLGASRGTCEFVLFLNPDARLLPDSLVPAIEFMQREENERVGICGIQLVGEDGQVARNCARFPTTAGLIGRAAGLDRLVPAAAHFMRDWDHASTRRVDQVMGAFFLVRRTVFDSLQGFDERFFVYFEDVDFSYRAMQLGWSSVYFAGARAFHAGGGTSARVKAHRLFYSLRSRILYAFKHFNPVAATAVLFATILIEPLSRSVLAVSRRSSTSLKETWRGYGMLARWLPNAIAAESTRKRRRVLPR